MTHDRDDENLRTHTPETPEAMRSRLIGQGVALGTGLGIAFGALLGLLLFENFILGMPIGLGLGVAIGVVVGSQRAAVAAQQQEDEGPGEESDASDRA